MYAQAREGCGTQRARAEITASMAVVAFANDEVDLSKQLLAEATSEPHLCTRALFITAALGLFAGDLQLAEAALGAEEQEEQEQEQEEKEGGGGLLFFFVDTFALSVCLIVCVCVCV